MKHTTMLLIMDGFGLAPAGPGNAITTAKTPNLDRLWAEWPHNRLQASGRFVGLPDGQMGNSEVGHTNMGAGRIVWQELSKISNEIGDGSFFENEVLQAAMKHVTDRDSTLHVFGLMSDGGVHSHMDHIKAVCEMARRSGVSRLYVHCFMDGRDTPPTSGAGYVADMEAYLAKLEGAAEDGKMACAKVGSVEGRYYAMDRDKRWDRVQLAYDALTEPVLPGSGSGKAMVEAAYGCGETDEFIQPRVCNGFDAIKDGDAVVFANFRPDRAREITRAFVDPDFESYGFKRGVVLKDLFYVCFTQYDVTIPNVEVAFKPQSLKNTLGEYVSSLGKTQLRIAETEKYAHVTFFFNGGVEEPYEGEKRILVPSPKVATYDLKPEMSAYEVTEKVLEEINSGDLDLIIMNLANCDMVGHTGVFEAAVAAVEAVDTCVGKVAEAIRAKGGDLIITADHGNADEMLDAEGNVVTAHSTNPVPVILVSDKAKKINEGALCDLAPTLLHLMGLEAPAEMEGKDLLA